MAVDGLQPAFGALPSVPLPLVAQGVLCPLGYRWCTRPSALSMLCHTCALQAAAAQPSSGSGLCIPYIHSHEWVGAPPAATGGGHCSAIGAVPSSPSVCLLL